MLHMMKDLVNHIGVSGPDGHYGFGGSCFPKDINALISVAKNKLDLCQIH